MESLEHPKFTDKEYYETKLPDGSRDDRAYNEPHSIRYTMNIDEMNAINSKANEFELGMFAYVQIVIFLFVLSG